MSGLKLGTQLTGSVVDKLYQSPTAVPPAGIPEGGTIAAAAYGPSAVAQTTSNPGMRAAIISGACLAALVGLWFVLPKG